MTEQLPHHNLGHQPQHKLPGKTRVNQLQMKNFEAGKCLVSLWGLAVLHRRQVVQGGSHRAVVFNESAVEVSEPQKPLHLHASGFLEWATLLAVSIFLQLTDIMN